MPHLAQLRLLVNLARADGEVVEKERQFIINIGQANHLLVSEILPLFSGDHPTIVPSTLTDEQKFNYVLSLTQLMHIDEKIYKEELRYCATVASRLGYQREALLELMVRAKDIRQGIDELAELKKLVATYLNRS